NALDLGVLVGLCFEPLALGAVQPRYVIDAREVVPQLTEEALDALPRLMPHAVQPLIARDVAQEVAEQAASGLLLLLLEHVPLERSELAGADGVLDVDVVADSRDGVDRILELLRRQSGVGSDVQCGPVQGLRLRRG